MFDIYGGPKNEDCSQLHMLKTSRLISMIFVARIYARARLSYRECRTLPPGHSALGHSPRTFPPPGQFPLPFYTV